MSLDKKLDVQEVFNETRARFRELWDFEPTLIELIYLREHVKKAVSSKEQGNYESSPDDEAIARFISDLYGISWHTAFVFTHGRGPSFGQYLKILQERAHFP